MHDIRRLGRDDVGAAASLLARAFADSPGYAAILRDVPPDRRVRAIERVKRGFVRASVRYEDPSGIWVDGQLCGVSLVLPAGKYPPGLLAHFWEATGVVTVGPRAIARFVRVETYTGSLHPREPHEYLFVLGVEPSKQGRGLGKALLGAMAAKADARGVPCYLETDKEANVRIYAAAGYEVRTDANVPGVGFRMWTMLRPVRGARSGQSDSR